MVATPTSGPYHRPKTNSMSSFQRNSFEKQQQQRDGGGGGVALSRSSPSGNSGYRGYTSGGANNRGNEARRTSSGDSGVEPSSDRHFFPSNTASPRRQNNNRGGNYGSSNMSRSNSDQLARQKQNWNAERDIPSGTVRNNPFLPQPKPQPPQPVQLVHQKKQWDTSNIPRGSVAARTQTMELESPRHHNNTSRLSGGKGTWQPQPIPINLETQRHQQASPHFNGRKSFDKQQQHVGSNVIEQSSSKRGHMIETGGAHEQPANATTSPKWEPSREIPKGTVKGRVHTLFGGEGGEARQQHPATSSSVPVPGAVKPPNSSNNRPSSMQRHQVDDDEDPWIIPNRNDKGRQVYAGDEWGEAAVVASKSSGSDEWDAPEKDWSNDEELFEEATPIKITKRMVPKQKQQVPVQQQQSKMASDDRRDAEVIQMARRKKEELHQHRRQQEYNQARSTSRGKMDRDAEILQAANEKRYSSSGSQQGGQRQVKDLLPSRGNALAPPSKDVSAYHHTTPTQQERKEIPSGSAAKSSKTVSHGPFEPFDDSFDQFAAAPSGRDHDDFVDFVDANDPFSPTRLAAEQDTFGFPTPTSSGKAYTSNQDQDEFFDAISSTKYEGPPSVSASQKRVASRESPGATKPEHVLSKNGVTATSNLETDESSVDEPKKKKKGGFFKGLFGKKNKEKETPKSKKSKKQGRNRPSWGSAKGEESPKNAQASQNRRSLPKANGLLPSDAIVDSSSTENYPESRGTHVAMGRSHDDTTISEMTNPTVFKDVSNPPAVVASKGRTSPPALSTIDSKEGDDTITPRGSPVKFLHGQDSAAAFDDQRKGMSVAVDLLEEDDDEEFVDPELDHLEMNDSDTDSKIDINEAHDDNMAAAPLPPPPPPPPVQRPPQTAAKVAPVNKSSSKFHRRLRERSPAREVVEEKKDDREVAVKSLDKPVPVGRRLSGSRYVPRTRSSKETEKVTQKPRQPRLSDHSTPSKSTSREPSPVPPRRGMRSMSPSSRFHSGTTGKPLATKETPTKTSTVTQPKIEEDSKAPSRLPKRSYGTRGTSKSAHPYQVSKAITSSNATGNVKSAKKTTLGSKKVNVTARKAAVTSIRLQTSSSSSTESSGGGSQSAFARRLAARKAKEDPQGSTLQNTLKTVARPLAKTRVPSVPVNESFKNANTPKAGPGTTLYRQPPRKNSIHEYERPNKRSIVATATNSSEDLTHASSSTYNTYQKKLQESLEKSSRKGPFSDLSVVSTRSNRSAAELSIPSQKSNDSSIGSDVRVLKTILRRPRLGKDYGDVIRMSQQNHGFQAYSEADATDPMQRVGLRLLSGAIIPIQTEVRRFLAARQALTRMWALIVIQTYTRRMLARQRFEDALYSVITIQRFTRGHITRVDVINKHTSATEIQRCVRGYLATMHVYEEIYKVTLVQSWVRMRIAMDDAAYRMALVIQVQAVARGFLQRRRLAQSDIAATIIQAHWRSFYNRLTYQFDLLDIIIVQSLWRRKIGLREANRRLGVKQYEAATLIQKTWRSYDCQMDYICFLAARKIQSAWRSYDCRMDYVCYLAARKIQSNWRAAVCREEFLNQIAAKIIQTKWRGFVCKQDYAHFMAARKIQTAWRASVCRQDYVYFLAARAIQTSWRAAVCRQDYVYYLAARAIQASWRASVCRNDYVCFLAARIIQAKWRSSICRKDYNAYMAARTIQSNWRCSVCRKDYIVYMAARTIQTNWRSSICRKDYNVYMAARTIQKNWRSSLCRKDYITYMSARTIQTNWRSSVCRKDYNAYIAARKIQTNWRAAVCREWYLHNIAAKMIQTSWRTSVCRKDYVAYTAARKIQASWRAAICRNKYLHHIAAQIIQTSWRSSICRKDYLAYMAARKIQTSWRAFICRKDFIEYFAATMIQAKWRTYSLRSAYVQYKAATKIQSVWRSYDCKMNYLHFLADILIIQSTFRRYKVLKQVNAKKHEAATVIQRTWRGFVCFADYEEYKVARKIQTAWRGYVCKAYYKEYMAARKIQTVWRGFVCYADYQEFLTVRKVQAIWRGYVRRNAFKRYMAARTIQKLWRGFVQFADYHEYLTVRRIQTVWRGYTCRNAYKRYHAATKIQSMQRRYVCHNAFRRYQAAKAIQAMWRGCLAFADYLEYLAVRRIQRAWMAYSITKTAKAEKAIIMEAANREKAAITIQCAWRGFVSYADYMFAVADIVAVQKMVRGFLAKKHYIRKRADARLNAAVTIQKNWRRFVDETEFVVMKYEYHAARTIQTAWRRFWCFSNFVIALDCSIQIQAHVRGYLQRKGFTSRRKSAVAIQRVVRQSMARQTVDRLAVICDMEMASIENGKLEYSAATKIQRIFRGTISRTALKVYLAAVKIQSHVRANQTRVAVKLYLMARKIQKTWRGFNPRRAYVTFVSARRIQNKWRYSKANQFAMELRGEKLAATLIQSAWRGFVCYTDYVFTLSDIVSAQRIARGYLSRKRYGNVIKNNLIRKKEEQNASILIQQACRGYQARQKYWFTLGCTMQIQSWWRGVSAKHEVQRQLDAVSVIQCFTRRCLARQQYLQRKFIFMLINTAEKERSRKLGASLRQGKSQDSLLEKERQDAAARIIQRFFLRVKFEVDQLVRAQKRRKKLRKKMMKAKKRPNSGEDSLLEDAWEAAISHTNMDDEPFTRMYTDMGSGSVVGMDNPSIDQESIAHVETGSINMAHPVTAALVDPPGSVASSTMKGSTHGSRSIALQQRRQQEDARYRLPPSTIRTDKHSSVVRLHHGYDDDTSVFSQLTGMTGSTMTFARPAHHIRVLRKVALNDMEDEFQLEEAFIDAEIFHAKERRQMASNSQCHQQQSARAPRPLRKSTGGMPAGNYHHQQHPSGRRVSHDGIAQTNSKGGDSVGSGLSIGRKREQHGQGLQPSGSRNHGSIYY